MSRSDFRRVVPRLRMLLRCAACAVAVAVAGCGGEDAKSPGGASATSPSSPSGAALPADNPTRLQATAPTLERSPLFGAAGGTSFDDPVNTQTELTRVTVRHGYWIDSVQAHTAAADLPAHGGSGGISNSFALDPGEYLVAIHGRQGANAVNPAISQISFVTNKGHVYGPYGQGLGQGQTTPFYWRVPYGARIVGFSGRAGTFLNAIGVQYVVEPLDPPVVATPIVGASGGVPFTDTVAAGQIVTEVLVGHGSWVDSIQAHVTPSNVLPRHGGGGGQNDRISVNERLGAGNGIARVRGFIGASSTTPAIAQLTFETFSKRTLGPFGLAWGQDPLTPFELEVPVGHHLVGFTGRAGTYLNALGLLTQLDTPPTVFTSPVEGANAGSAFTDPVAAGQWMHALTVRHGAGVDGIQGFEGGFALPAHGGLGGNATTVVLDPGEYLVNMSGGVARDATGPAIRWLSLRSNRGREFGPFGDANLVGEFFYWGVPFGGRIVGFVGRKGEGAVLNAIGVQYVIDVDAPVTVDAPAIHVAGDTSSVFPRSFLPGEWLAGVQVTARDWVERVFASTCSVGAPCNVAGPDGFNLDRSETLVRMFGLAGGNPTTPSIAQISFVSNWGRTYGPFGAGLGQDPTTPFDFRAPTGMHILDIPNAIALDAPPDGPLTFRTVAIAAQYQPDFLRATTSPAFGSPLGFEFHDQVATGQVLTGVRINHDYWIDSIQGLASPFDLARHGGHGGNNSSFALSAGEHLVRIYGLQGANPAVPAIAQISFETSTGRTFGPYGQGLGQDPTTPFDYRVPARGRIVGFSGRAHEYLNAIGVQFVIDPR